MNAKRVAPDLPHLTDDQEFAAASQRLAELRADLATIEAKRTAALAEFNAIASSGPVRGDPVELAALALIAGSADAPPPSAAASALRKLAGELTDQAQVIGRAVAIQASVVAELRQAATHRVCGSVAPQHRELVRNVVDAIRALDAALVAERALRDELEARGFAVSSVVRPMPLPALGRLDEPHSRASAYLLECVEFGFLDKSELPPNLQKFVPPPPAPPKGRIAEALANWGESLD